MDILSDINVSGTLTIGKTKLNEIIPNPCAVGETIATSTITILDEPQLSKTYQIKYDSAYSMVDYGDGLFDRIAVNTLANKCGNGIYFPDCVSFGCNVNVSRGNVVFDTSSTICFENILYFSNPNPSGGNQLNHFRISYVPPTKTCATIESSLEAMKYVFFNDTIPADCQKFRINLFAFFNESYCEKGGFSKCPLLQMVDNSTHKVVYPDFEFVFEEEKDRQYVAVNITMEHSDEIEACRFTLTAF